MIEGKFVKDANRKMKAIIERLYEVKISDERWQKEAEIITSRVMTDLFWRIYSYKDTPEFKKIHGFDLMQKFLTKEETTNSDIITGYDESQ